MLNYLLLGSVSSQDLNAIVTYHLLNQFLLYSPDFPVQSTYQSQQGAPITLASLTGTYWLSLRVFLFCSLTHSTTTTGPTGNRLLRANNADVLGSTIASNGAVHVIDEVLLPPTFQFTINKVLYTLSSTLFRGYLTKVFYLSLSHHNTHTLFSI